MWLGVAPVPVPPSPNVHAYEAIDPSGSLEPLPLKETASGAIPDVGVAVAEATGGWFEPPAGITNSVMLCCGTVRATVEPLTGTSERCVIVFADVSCQTWALVPAPKFTSESVTGVEPDSTLFTTITVSAPSLERVAANADSESGSGTVAETLVSPNVDLLPS